MRIINRVSIFLLDFYSDTDIVRGMLSITEKKWLNGTGVGPDPSGLASRKGRTTGHGRAATRPYQGVADDQGEAHYTFLRNEPNLFSSENRIYVIGLQ